MGAATKDQWIEKLINDATYKIYDDGTILTQVTKSGKLSKNGAWRKLTHMQREYCVHIKYKGIFLQLHRVIYRKFLGSLDPNKVINHKDGDTRNNKIANLELVTQAENNKHRFRCGKPGTIGNAKITYLTASLIRREHEAGTAYNALATKYSMSKTSIHDIVTRKTWTHDRQRTGRHRGCSNHAAEPPWVNNLDIQRIYACVPNGMTVDHIIPISNRLVCGLHVPWNLQYLTRSDNSIKSYKFDGTYENNSWKIAGSSRS
jgi:hypothetical protein